MPILGELMPLLEARFAGAANGETLLVSIRGQGHIERQYDRACKAASVPRRKRRFQTLRSSCEIQMAMTFSQYAVSNRIGHSIHISGKHYANHVPNELFTLAANHPVKAHRPSSRILEAVQNAVRSSAVMFRKAS